uniref:Uncharacterized protein n=1 Tax=Picea sitchensis TaxID=3332 RepID=D5ADZ3_PICSI|nr:unknown [Picea sitchensis]
MLRLGRISRERYAIRVAIYEFYTFLLRSLRLLIGPCFTLF